MSVHRLSAFRVLTFDVYGTLVDWENGLWRRLESWLKRVGVALSREQVLEAFASAETRVEREQPTLAYSRVLERVHMLLAEQFGVPLDAEEALSFGRSVGSWPVFDDTLEALLYLQQHYRLVVLSNVDHRSFEETLKLLPGVKFGAVYLAEDIGSYKPALENFRYMLQHEAEAGFSQHDILHTAQSLFHDHERASSLGLHTNWIDRRHAQEGWGATAPPATAVKVDFHHKSMADFVQQHRLELAQQLHEAHQ